MRLKLNWGRDFLLGDLTEVHDVSCSWFGGSQTRKPTSHHLCSRKHLDCFQVRENPSCGI